jgi:hypothetical protein
MFEKKETEKFFKEVKQQYAVKAPRCKILIETL